MTHEWKSRAKANKLLSVAAAFCMTMSLAPFQPAYSADDSRSPHFRSPNPTTTASPAAHVFENQLVVRVAKDADGTEVKNALKDIDGTVVRSFEGAKGNVMLVQVTSSQEKGKTFKDKYEKLSKDKHFADVSLNYKATKEVFPFTLPNDPCFPADAPSLNLINVPTAWANGGSGNNVVVGVIDTGVNGRQFDLHGRVLRGYNTLTGGTGNRDSDADFGHGTFCATTIAAATNNRTLGSAPAYRAVIYPIDIFNGSDSASFFDIAFAVSIMRQRGVKLVNMSVGANPPFSINDVFIEPSYFPELRDEFIAFYNAGGLFFNSAGNANINDSLTTRTQYLITSAAVDNSGCKCSFSSYGPKVWFASPGCSVVSSSQYNVCEAINGTSFASPLSCSIAAQIWGVRPRLSNAQVLTIMQNNVFPAPGTGVCGFPADPLVYGFGIPNAGGAVQQARGF